MRSRSLHAALAAIAMIFVASTASATVLFVATAGSASGNPLDALAPGDLITIDIRIASTGSPAVAGIGAAIFGYDSGVVEFVSGSAVASVLHDQCLPGIGCFNGLDNQVAGTLSERQVTTGTFPEPYVQIFNGVSTTARAGTGLQDPGLDGVVGAGDAQFRATFRIGNGTTSFSIGTNSVDPILGNAVVVAGGAIEDAVNASIQVSVIPEPGGALLLGLGLAGMATGRRQSRSCEPSSCAPTPSTPDRRSHEDSFRRAKTGPSSSPRAESARGEGDA